jgi:hypothetical protein
LTEELQTCGKGIYTGTGVLIGTVEGFTVEQSRFPENFIESKPEALL